MENKDTYFVAVKVFLQDAEGRLLITKDRFGDWDIPGGRLREMDFDTPLEDVVKRKMSEELGDAFEYELGEQVLTMRHKRNEILPDQSRAEKRIFALGYRARYKSGALALGKNHGEHQWVDLKTFKPSDYFTGGWLKGVQEFQSKFA